MVPILELSLRQLAGRWRLLIIFFLRQLIWTTIVPALA